MPGQPGHSQIKLQEEFVMPFAQESGPDNVVVIKVIGVGGAGNNVVNRMVQSEIGRASCRERV